MATTATPEYIRGVEIQDKSGDLREGIAASDAQLSFLMSYARGKSVLDVGCVDHDPNNYKSPYWVHKALCSVAREVVGIDLYKEGVEYLQRQGFDVRFEDAQDFNLGRTFDVIAAGEIIEHMGNFEGFFNSARAHLAPGGVLALTTPNPWYWRVIAKAVLKGGDVPNNPEHTCWFDPMTLRQLASRYGFRLSRFSHGSRYMRDRIMPLPKALKHTSFFAELRPD